jgi:uncharacterized integral membrane protein
MRALRTLAIGALFLFAMLLGVLAFVDNSSDVALRFLDWQTPTLSLYWWLLGALLTGIAIGWLAASVTVVRAKVAQRRATRELATSTRELATSARGLAANARGQTDTREPTHPRTGATEPTDTASG